MVEGRPPHVGPLVIYDGDCAFCTTSVQFLQRRIRRHPRFEPWQFLDLVSIGISQESCEQAVQFIDANGSVHSGERAIAHLLIHGGKGWKVMGGVLLVPGIRHVAGAVYRWIAQNRHRLPGGTAQCSLPAEQRASVTSRTTTEEQNA